MKVINDVYFRYVFTTTRLISKERITGFSDKNEMYALYDQNNSYNVRDGLYILRAMIPSRCAPFLDLRKTLLTGFKTRFEKFVSHKADIWPTETLIWECLEKFSGVKVLV